MILRNLMHYIIYPLIGALPPSVGEYTLLKMIIYPLLWAAPFVFGSRKVKRFAFFGLIWIVMTSLPYLPWIMGVQGFFPRICDIPSRYFNLPSMGAAMVMVSFIWMLWKKWGRRTAIPALILLTVTLTMFSVEWVRRETRRFVRNGIVTELLLNVMKDSYSPGRILYVGSFGFRPSRIASYNIMYFDGNLVQCQPFPQNVPEGTRLLCGPNTSPVLFYLENGNWTLQRRYDDCQAEADGMIRMN